MTLEFGVNIIRILIAAVISFVFGWIWYGPLFGKTWMKLSNISPSNIEKAKKKGMASMMIFSFIGTLVTAFVLSVLIISTGASNVAGVVILGFWIWLGFLAATTLLGSVLWDNKPWGLFVLNGAYWLINIEILGIVLAVWPW